jgi:Tetracyclin repressor-like, C-terminal domain
VTTWDSPTGSPLLGLIRSVVTNETAAALLRDFVSREILARLAARLELERPELQASLGQPVDRPGDAPLSGQGRTAGLGGARRDRRLVGPYLAAILHGPGRDRGRRSPGGNPLRLVEFAVLHSMTE